MSNELEGHGVLFSRQVREFWASIAIVDIVEAGRKWMQIFRVRDATGGPSLATRWVLVWVAFVALVASTL
ncbi:MAG: hypothetical protein A2749_00915 [Parcubacteria group bacterium RIFCSPHIGHO2_01_FULL_45_26]|nr:MAG: hypothetical protein A2749_00915 [Parcubacteria group bacterium RIFCSPHIGHO2_01_FULL_45_26]